MANPFQDKFLKAGLVNKKQVNKAKVEQRTKTKGQKKHQPTDDPAARAAEQALAQKKAQAKQSNAQRDQAARDKEVVAQIKQMITTNRVPPGKGDTPYHFADSTKIKKIYLTKGLIDQLSSGKLGIAKLDGTYELIPAETAAKIRERRPEALIVFNDHPPADDPYAEFPIPDDYDW
ncbi:MAG: DUF2058 domain-containing protein [Proteobacteria bacterium]|nr:DUF2058 domain-containing protein [Pseudomonadota bacterium]MBU1686671.1 DUF2058 domain-containing protein [Pseudomonadota bacterium]